MPIYSGGGVGGSGSALTTLRKSTTKTVNTTVTKTDLLNGSITIPANALSSTGVLIGYVWGDWINNSGGASAAPLLAIGLGGSDLVACANGAGGINAVNSAQRFAWAYQIIIAATNATNVQSAQMFGTLSMACGAGTANVDTNAATGEGICTVAAGANAKATSTFNGFNTAAVDMTQAQTLTFSTTNTSPSASYEVKLFGALFTIF